MADHGRGGGGSRGHEDGGSGRTGSGGAGDIRETVELRRLRGRIDALDRRIVRLLNERAELAREVGREKRRQGRRGVRDLEREREVLLRVAMANLGPMRQADLLAIYRRMIAAARAIETADGTAERQRAAASGAVDTPPAERDPGAIGTLGTAARPARGPGGGPRAPHLADDGADGEPPAGGG
jgi:chorismate mutase